MAAMLIGRGRLLPSPVCDAQSQHDMHVRMGRHPFAVATMLERPLHGLPGLSRVPCQQPRPLQSRLRCSGPWCVGAGQWHRHAPRGHPGPAGPRAVRDQVRREADARQVRPGRQDGAHLVQAQHRPADRGAQRAAQAGLHLLLQARHRHPQVRRTGSLVCTALGCRAAVALRCTPAPCGYTALHAQPGKLRS